jgi:hypothetical protein
MSDDIYNLFVDLVGTGIREKEGLGSTDGL